MTKRNPLAVVALSILTFGVYAYYWLYKTTDELRDKTGREELHPAMDVILAILTIGIWGIWAGYRNARIVHEEMVARGVEHRDRSLPVAGIAALSFVSGWAWLVAMAMVQEDLNRFEDAEADVFSGARALFEDEEALFEVPAPAVRARVEVEPAERPVPASRWNDAPKAPVFRSNAPMPVVF